MNLEKTTQLLLVGDDTPLLALLKAAIQASQLTYSVMSHAQGPDLSSWLVATPKPAMIWLVLTPPFFPSLELLKQVKADAVFGSVPVVVLGASRVMDVINLAYHYGATAYLIPPPTYQPLVERLTLFSRYWGEPLSETCGEVKGQEYKTEPHLSQPF